jgi:hypothetical protein
VGLVSVFLVSRAFYTDSWSKTSCAFKLYVFEKSTFFFNESSSVTEFCFAEKIYHFQLYHFQLYNFFFNEFLFF